MFENIVNFLLLQFQTQTNKLNIKKCILEKKIFLLSLLLIIIFLIKLSNATVLSLYCNFIKIVFFFFMVKFTPLIKILLICKILFTYKVKLLVLKKKKILHFQHKILTKPFVNIFQRNKFLPFFKEVFTYYSYFLVVLFISFF